jgi:hypothetical protein
VSFYQCNCTFAGTGVQEQLESGYWGSGVVISTAAARAATLAAIWGLHVTE